MSLVMEQEITEIERDSRWNSIVKRNAAADGTFHLAAEREEHIHFDREREQDRRSVHQRVGGNPPDLAEIQNSCAVELEIVEHGSGAGCDQNARDNRERDVEADQHRRHIDGIAPHPCDRPIIIGGSDSEHDFN